MMRPRLFKENEIIMIEEKQETNVFEDVMEHIEDNYLEIEQQIAMIKRASIIKPNGDREDESEDLGEKNKKGPFNA